MMSRTYKRRIKIFPIIAFFLGMALAVYVQDDSNLISVYLEKLFPSHIQTGPVQPFSADNGLRVHFVDVGQADATILQSGNDIMLIDAGLRDTSGTLIDYIKSLGVNKIKYVIATHPHDDHIGGMVDVMEAFEVESFIAPDVSHTTKSFEFLMSFLDREGLEMTVPNAGDSFGFGGAVITILSPPIGNTYDELNNYSVIVKAEYGKNSFLFMGDAEALIEKEIMAAGFDLKADLLKVGHHGSASSSTEEFLDAVNPIYAIISCGVDNTYDHPSKWVIQRLHSIRAEIYETTDLGTIIATCDGNAIEVTNLGKQAVQ